PGGSPCGSSPGPEPVARSASSRARPGASRSASAAGSSRSARSITRHSLAAGGCRLCRRPRRGSCRRHTAYVSYHESAQRAALMQLFSRHVSREVAEAIWRDREQFLDGGRPRPQRLAATVLFTDLVGFTSTSEHLEPQVLVDWLNEYMDVMVQQVLDRG